MKSNVSRETLYDYQYNKKFKFSCKYLGDMNLLILLNDKELIYYDLDSMDYDKFTLKEFKELVNYLCKNNYEILKEKIYYQMKEMILNEV